MPDICNDNRFEIIAEYKKRLIEGTNIETSPEEMAVIDNILFRFWQMGWLVPNKPHRRNGYWIEDAKTYPGAGLSNYVCSNCGEMGGTWIKHIAPDRTPPFCNFCGTKMSGKKVKYAE